MNEFMPEQTRERKKQIRAFSKRLGSRDGAVRHAAEQEVQAMGPAGRDLLIALMHEEEKQRVERRNGEARSALTFFGIGGAVGLLLMLWHGTFPILNFFFTQALVSLVFCVYFHFRASMARVNAAYLLAKYYDDVSIIGPLAEALAFRAGSERKAATTALTRLLPRVQDTDEVTLNTNQREDLYRALMTNNRELVLAILNSLVRIGDSKALANVQKLAAGQGVAATDNGVREAAQTVLLTLRQRIESQRAPHTLLRASSAADARIDELVRPASGVAEPQKQVLLRATSGATEETP